MTNKLRTVSIAILFVLLCSSVSLASEGSKPFFWKMTDSEGSSTSYLLGSIHLGLKEIYPLPERLYKAFDSSDVLVLEIDMTNINPSSIAEKAVFKGEQTLESTVSKEHFKLFDSIFTSLGVPKEYYNKLKPWFATIMISTTMMGNLGMEAELGIDLHFMEKASEREMKIDQLESFDFQMDLFNSVPDSLADELIDYNLKDLVQTDGEDVRKLIKAYISGDEKEIESLLVVDSGDSFVKYFNSLILTKRNYTMADKIVEFHKSGKKCFIIAGAAHFVGEEGIIELLRSKGYKIERISG